MTIEQFLFFIVLPLVSFFYIKNKMKKYDLWLKQQHKEEREERERIALHKEKLIEQNVLEKQKKKDDRIKRINYLLYKVTSEIHSETVKVISERYPLLPIYITDADLDPLLFSGFKDTEIIRDGIAKGLKEYQNYVAGVYKKHSNKLKSKPISFLFLEEKSFWLNEHKYRKTDNAKDPEDWLKRREIVFVRENTQCQRCGLKLNFYNQTHIHHIVPRLENGGHDIANLALLCKSCHSFMPSFGHTEIRAQTTYYISKKKTAYTEKCRYANHAQKKIISHAKVLKRKGYKICKLCKPLSLHEELLENWTPEIEQFMSEHIKIVLERLSYIQKYVFLDDLEVS